MMGVWVCRYVSAQAHAHTHAPIPTLLPAIACSTSLSTPPFLRIPHTVLFPTQDRLITELLTGSDLVAAMCEEEAVLLETIKIVDPPYWYDPDDEAGTDPNDMLEHLFNDANPEYMELMNRQTRA